MSRKFTFIGRFLAVCSVLFVLSSCRVDTTINLTVNRDGSGTVVVTITADNDIVKQAPGLADDLNFADVKTAGWKVDGPAATEDGGLKVVLTHDFKNELQASALLMQLNGNRGPFRDVTVRREGKPRDSTWSLSGRLEVTGGLQAFADDDLLKSLGATPYEDTVKNAGLDLGKALSITFTAKMPGSLKSTTGLEQGDVITWRVATDGTPVDLATTTENVDVVGTLGNLVSKVGLVLLVLWLALMGVLAVLVYNKQQRRRPRQSA